MLEVLASVSHFAVTGPALVSVLLACSVFLVSLGAVTCFCYKRREQSKAARGRGRPLAFTRRPAAVRSPATNTHYLKKTPSPTSRPPSASPIGSGSNSPSGATTLLQSAKSSPGTSPTCEDPTSSVIQGAELDTSVAKLHTEDEIREHSSLSTKDEIENGEKESCLSIPTSGKLGQLIFKIRYKKEKSTLVVSVVKCKDLPAKDPNVGSSDPYVKLQLLPEKQHKVKTRVLRKTRNPVYDEDFTFYGISIQQLQNITLHFVVLSFDRYSRDDIIGEVFCSLDTVDVAQAENQQMSLCREIQPRSLKIKSQGRGELLVSLCWQPVVNKLSVVVLKARNLPKMDVTGLADPYVKMYLMYNGQRIAKKKTHVKKRTLNPVFNESFAFDIPQGAESLDKTNLEFLLLDWDRVTKNEVIGRLELGGVKSSPSAQHHWNEVRNSPRRQIAEWHKLRE
ncbi:synaptotagmin-4 isoform X2 [Cimex lectularius]|uniref:C2 domain-containing protein n=1 Tax=Cimex lectularius TaxID=79782 RepID=A0A8I6RSY9_CIMLE|nr:synaptotagmin-4 isoform X2 [Cimex lectularius]XP_024081394.1 synaptotagmin-4 isoform X2 [Cimex lectularius]